MTRPSDLSPVDYAFQLTGASPPFINRQVQLEQYEHVLQKTIAGKTCVLLLQGEAGIGKTRLIKEMQNRAERHAFTACAGRCHEDLMLPYLPFVEALREPWGTYQALAESTLGTGAQLMDQFLRRDGASPLTDSLSFVDQADQDRLRLFLVVSQAMVWLAQQSPLLMVLDDLHWADQPSLDLFSHVIFAIADRMEQTSIPLCIIGTYRPVSPDDRLARLLGRFEREDLCQVMNLSGLNETDMQALIHGLGLSHPSRQLMHTLSEVTHGSPLFVQEMLRHLIQQNALHQRDGRIETVSAPSDLRLPRRVTDAILLRTQGLSPDCRRTLTFAALLGETFALNVLSEASQVLEDDLLPLLEEGLHQGVLLSEGQTFQFPHPLVRHALYNTPSVAQRQRFHWQIAQALERLYPERLSPQLLEIAHHVVQAGPVADPASAGHYAGHAGDYAFTVFDWKQAAYYYTAALVADERINALAEPERATMHYRLGLAYARDGDISRSDEYFDRAIASFHELGNLRGEVRALIEKTLRMSSVPYGTLVDLQPFEILLETIGEDEADLRGYLATAMSEVYWAGRQPERAIEMARQGLAIGQALEDGPLCATASFDLGLAQMQHLDIGGAVESYEQARRYAQRANHRWLEGWPLQNIGSTLVMMGRFSDVESVAADAYEVAAETNNWGHYSLTCAARTVLAVARGDFEAAENHVHETMMFVSRTHVPFGGALALPAIACAHALRGNWAAAEEFLDVLLEPGRVFRQPGAAFTNVTQVYRHLVQLYGSADGDGRWPGTASLQPAVEPGHLDITSLPLYCALLELAAAGPQPESIIPLYRALSPVAAQGVRFSRSWVFLLPRLLGVAASGQAWWEEAELHFQEAIAAATAVGARPELGRTYLDYARMLASRRAEGDHDHALDWLRRALSLLNELGMVPFHRQAMQLMVALQNGGGPSPPVAAAYRDPVSAQEVAMLLEMTQEDTDFLGR